jgi:hypothetical protein
MRDRRSCQATPPRAASAKRAGGEEEEEEEEEEASPLPSAVVGPSPAPAATYCRMGGQRLMPLGCV